MRCWHSGRPVRPGARRWADAGSITAETAAVLPGLVLVLVLLLWAVQVVAAQIRCIDAARVAVRAAARGETSALARQLAARAAPPHASVQVTAQGEQAVVVVRAAVPALARLPFPAPSVSVSATSTAPLEPSATSTAPLEPSATSTAPLEPR